MKKVTAKASVNIALIKYWGKENDEEVVPYNSSLSMTLDNLYTITTIIQSNEDFSFYLNGKKQETTELEKVKSFLKLFTSEVNLKNVKVISQNFVPTAAGLASSASGFAALAVAANKYFETNYCFDKLAYITRKGSGSACRSLLGGFVAWEKDGTIYNLELPKNKLLMVSVIIEEGKKVISSRDAMKLTVNTSPLYKTWIREANNDFKKMKEAFIVEDYKQIGVLTEKSAKLMHATMLVSDPPILYMKEQSFNLWQLISSLRNKGIYAYATMDAGSNVKVLTTKDDLENLEFALKQNNFSNYIISGVGEGACIIE